MKHPLHLIIDTDFGLDDVCAILYLFYEMYTSQRRKVIIHHISLCQGQQLDTRNGIRQLYSMLKNCGVKFSTPEHQFKVYNELVGKQLDGEDINPDAYLTTLSHGPNKEELFETDDTCESERIHHHFVEGDWYDSLNTAQNQVCQTIGIPVGKQRSSMLDGDSETQEPLFEDFEVQIMENDSAEVLLQLVQQRPHFYSLFAIGPLTNIRLVLQKDPEWLNKLRHVYFMAGNFICEGNTPNIVSEWNLFADPLSARHVFDNIEKHPFLGDNENDHARHCRVLGLEVANLDVFPADLQQIMLEKTKEAKEWNRRHDKLPEVVVKYWPVVDRITETMHKVMAMHYGSCSFDVVAAMALMREDVVHEYHRLRCSIERRKPREGECVVIIHHEDQDDQTSVDVVEATTSTNNARFQYQRSIHIKEVAGTDFESIQGGALVDVGVSIDTCRFRKVVEIMMNCQVIPDEIEDETS